VGGHPVQILVHVPVASQFIARVEITFTEQALEFLGVNEALQVFQKIAGIGIGDGVEAAGQVGEVMRIFGAAHQVDDIGPVAQDDVIVVGCGMEKSMALKRRQPFLNLAFKSGGDIVTKLDGRHTAVFQDQGR